MPAVFVHVSDIHFGQEKDDRIHIHYDVKQQLITDAYNVISSIPNRSVEGILVSGDIAHSGTRKEYEEAGKWLDALTEKIGIEKNRVQMVPGNHDLDRSKLSISGKLLLDHIRDGGSEEYEAVLQNRGDSAALYARFEDYSRFSNAYNCPLNSDGSYASEMIVSLAPERSIRFIRFNSSLLCHGKEHNEQPELMIGARQFTIPRDSGVENIILVHHPLSWYKDEEQVKNYIRSRARVFISGHEHNPKVTIDNVEDGSDLLMLAAGATVPYQSNDVYTFTYNILEFDWDEEMDRLLVTIHPRAWNPKRTCFESDNNRLGGKAPTFSLQSPFFRAASTEKGISSLIENEISPIVIESDPIPEKTLAEKEAIVSKNHEIQKKEPNNHDYEITKFHFFRDLYEGERLRILVELGALPDNFDEQMNQGLERKLLEMIVKDGNINQLKSMVDEIISDRKDKIK
ncbi:metallophosphoesterase [Providencia sp. PROV188]|uniref:metallophosphoesterase n=1 Tax=Providencia sp. PROV188 TaxID=2939731 RepID=UPI0022DE86AE|nr:metallophosphoesterase [Providencia sp. PROV188]WBM59657.1 metallophosphoesterase [Providencia sp. PROV188]